MSEAKLSVVATPIGNLEDVTLRALRILTEADVIFCEDMRVTGRLLDRYEITTRMTPLNARTERVKLGSIIGALSEGKRVALVTDAGTPGISDPGALVVGHVREKLPEITIEAIPGPSALTSALSIAGVHAHEFVFLGFLPHKKGRQTLFKEIATTERAVVFYESPHRIMKTLASLADVLPDDRMVVIARELTKIFEEIVRGSAKEVQNYFETQKEKQRGEFVIIIAAQ